MTSGKEDLSWLQNQVAFGGFQSARRAGTYFIEKSRPQAQVKHMTPDKKFRVVQLFIKPGALR